MKLLSYFFILEKNIQEAYDRLLVCYDMVYLTYSASKLTTSDWSTG